MEGTTEIVVRRAKNQNTLVDTVENAEMAEIKREVFRALTRLRAATTKEFDTIVLFWEPKPLNALSSDSSTFSSRRFTEEQTVEVPVPQIRKEIGEVIQLNPPERNSDRVVELNHRHSRPTDSGWQD